MKQRKIQTALRLTEEMHYKLTQIAQNEHRSFNAQLEYWVQNCVKDYEKEHGEIP
ncbi:MAG TPA: hypothetical protein IAA83_02625, partial [Candidatus Avoscillospira avistercoris]|nr:hypothetical protein [Candidatus Avoscillospira avistercoris]